MTKILLPLLVVAGLVLGIALLVARRRIAVPAEGSRLKVIVLTVAALVAGSLGLAHAQDKGGKISCYMPALDDDVAVVPTAPSIETVMKRIEMLEKLHAQGKLTREAYSDSLAALGTDLEAIEQTKKHKKELTKAEKKLMDLQRALDVQLLKKLIKKSAWKKLDKQVGQLLKLIDGKPNSYDPDKVKEAIDDLHADGLIASSTRSGLSTTLDEIRYHYERAHSGKTCYDMSALGADIQGFRGQLTTLLKGLKGKAPSKKQFVSHLGVLAVAVSCLETRSQAVCDQSKSPSTYDRLSMVQTLDLLAALAR
jgi:DNA repair exonuclease SbcCD ATPase subunit